MMMQNKPETRTDLTLPADPNDYDVEMFISAVLQDKGNRQQWITAPYIANEYGLTGHQAKQIAAFMRRFCKYYKGGRHVLVRVSDRRKVKMGSTRVTEYLCSPVIHYVKKK